LYGLKNFNPKLKISGVIFNFVNTESHYSFLKDACEDVGIETLGYVPSDSGIAIPSRHLGLAISSENDYETIIENAAQHLAKSIDVDRLLDLCQIPKKEVVMKSDTMQFSMNFKIAVARDEVFNFTYFENIKALENLGEVIYFSPLKDAVMPEADMLYLAGGYPELHLEALTANTSMRKSILHFCSNGGKVIAECGGMMYLGN
jgi:cobyrinic acid a,c-diamide synthase